MCNGSANRIYLRALSISQRSEASVRYEMAWPGAAGTVAPTVL